MLKKRSRILTCDSNNNSLLSFIFDEITKKKTRHIRGVTTLNATLEPVFNSMFFPSEKSKETTSVSEERNLF